MDNLTFLEERRDDSHRQGVGGKGWHKEDGHTYRSPLSNSWGSWGDGGGRTLTSHRILENSKERDAADSAAGCLKKPFVEGKLADSSGKWRVSAGPVITQSRERRNRDHTVWRSLCGMLEGAPARDGAGRCYRGQWGGMSDVWHVWSVTQSVTSFVPYCVFPAFVSLHASLHISPYLLHPARLTLRLWLLVGCWPPLSLEEPLLLYLFVNRAHPFPGQHSRDWPGSLALNGLSDKAAGGWGSCIFPCFPFDLSHLLSNYWAPCVVNHATGLFSDLVIQFLNHTDPPFYPSPDVFINMLHRAWESSSYKITWTSKMMRNFNS